MAGPTHIHRARPLQPMYEAPLGQPERTSATDQADEPGTDTVDGVPTTSVALARRRVPNGPLERAELGVRAPPIRRRQQRARWTLQRRRGSCRKTRATPSKRTPNRFCCWEARETSWRLNPRAPSAAVITSSRRSQLSGEMPCTLILSTCTEQTGSATVMRGAQNLSRAWSRPVPVMRTTCSSASVQTWRAQDHPISMASTTATPDRWARQL